MSNAQSGSSKRRKADSGVAINVSVPKPDTGASTPVFGALELQLLALLARNAHPR